MTVRGCGGFVSAKSMDFREKEGKITEVRDSGDSDPGKRGQLEQGAGFLDTHFFHSAMPSARRLMHW